MELKNFEKNDYTLNGIYRGVVEDNNDPDDSGRVRVRVFGIHDSMDNPIPVNQLPWACPALGLYWSGGFNLKNQDSTPGVDRYYPGSKSTVAGTNIAPESYNNTATNEFSEERLDPYMNACGTGGQFVVPKNGNWVFIFFDGGNPMRPIYFAMATNGRDWKTQADARNKDIYQKINQIKEFKKSFKEAETKIKKENPIDTTGDWTDSALVDSKVTTPTLDIKEIASEKPNKDIYSVTSPNGTTIVIDNRNGKERLYIIHKNTIDHIDENGNKKIYIGKNHNGEQTDFNTIPDPKSASNYEIGVEGDHELNIIGNYKTFVIGDIGIKSLGNIQIESAKHVGITINNGDLDLIVNKGTLNAKVNGNLNANVFENANIKVDNMCNLTVKKDLNISVDGNFSLKANGNISFETKQNMNMSISNKFVSSASEFDITTPMIKTTGQMNIGGNTKITGTVSATQDVVAGQILYSLIGVDTGGFLRNRGIADIGGPVIAHMVNVVGGMGSGTGRPAQSAEQPNVIPDPLPEIQKTISSTEKENFSDKRQRLS